MNDLAKTKCCLEEKLGQVVDILENDVGLNHKQMGILYYNAEHLADYCINKLDVPSSDYAMVSNIMLHVYSQYFNLILSNIDKKLSGNKENIWKQGLIEYLDSGLYETHYRRMFRLVEEYSTQIGEMQDDE